MSNSAQARLTFHQHTFFELTAGSRTLFIDPVFSHERRGRRVADEVRPADYVLATSMTPWFEDVLDVLDASEATFIATPRVARKVQTELGLRRSRVLDLEPWERASEPGFRVTAMPITGSIGMENAIEEGTSVIRDVTNIFPAGASRIPLVGQLLPMLDSGIRQSTKALETIPNMGRQVRSMDRMGEMFGLEMNQITGGRPGIGFLFELEGYPTVLHLADGVHAGTNDEDLEDMADVAQPDVLIVHVAGMEVEPLVRAVRTLNPKTVLLYRSRDPYAAGRRGQTLPISSFIGAIEEGASGCEVLHMRKGDTYILEPKEAAKTAPAPTAQPKYTSPNTPPKPASAVPQKP